MLTDEEFINALKSLDRRAKGNRSYGFRQDLWQEIIDELEFLNDVLAYIDTEVAGLVHEAAEAVEKARAK